jgi:4'-phosphopantetheinyl transferase EntD
MFSSPFPKECAFVEITQNEHCDIPLFFEEEKILSEHVSEKRRKEFVLGRRACHLALSQIGFLKPVLKGERGEPLWPSGVLGSISHCDDFAAVAVVPQHKYKAVGLDIEKTTRDIDIDLIELISDPSEKILCGNSKQFVIELFSAKEAIYKALFPLVKNYIDFRDVTLKQNTNGFEGRLNKDLSIDFPRGFAMQVNLQRLTEYSMSSIYL